MTKIHFSKKRLRFTVLKLETSYFGFWLIMYQYTLFIKHLALNPFLKCFLDGRMIAKGAGFPVGPGEMTWACLFAIPTVCP